VCQTKLAFNQKWDLLLKEMLVYMSEKPSKNICKEYNALKQLNVSKNTNEKKIKAFGMW